MNLNQDHTWQHSTMQDFWGEIAPADHLVQVYENETVFMNTLEGFVGSGILANDTVVLIATKAHIEVLSMRLKNQCFDLNALEKSQKLILLDAEETLSKFMQNGWPNEKLFFETIRAVFKNAKSRNTRVRAFGEMVAILWEQKNYGATVHLEHLWNKFCESQEFCLYCAYPKSGFTNDPAESIKNICCTHSKVIAGFPHPSTHIQYSAIG